MTWEGADEGGFMQPVTHRLRAPIVIGRRSRRGDRSARPAAGYARLRRAGWFCALCLIAASAAGEDFSDSEFNESLSTESVTSARVEEELRVDMLADGASSWRLKRSAVKELPLDRLTPTGRRLADSVLDELSVHRRLPVLRCETDPRVLRFFLQHPDVAVGIWRAMDVSDMQLQPIGPDRYRSNCGDGSNGVMTLLMNDSRNYLVHCRGLFKSPVLSKAIEASALMWLRMETQRDAAGRLYVKCQADIFVAFPSHTVETAARIVSPVTNRIADRNFHEVTMFIRMMHLAMTQQPGWIEQVAGNMRGVSEDRGQALVDTAAIVYADAHKKLAHAGGETLTPESLRLPNRREPETAAAEADVELRQPVEVAATPDPVVQ